MKKPAKKAVKAAPRKAASKARTATRAKQKTPVRAAKSVPEVPKGPVKRPKTTASAPTKQITIVKSVSGSTKAKVVAAKSTPVTPKAQAAYAKTAPVVSKVQIAVEKSIQRVNMAPVAPKAPVADIKSVPRAEKERAQAFVIPPILLETAPAPLAVPILETPVDESQLSLNKEVASVHSDSVSAPIPRSLDLPIAEYKAPIPSLMPTTVAPAQMEPEVAPEAFQPVVEAAVTVAEPSMEFRAPGRGVLRLLARDPHCLFATWDFPIGSLELHRLRSADGFVHLRVYAQGQGEERDVALTAEASEWFIPVDRAGSEYHVEMGYRNRAGAWVPMADAALATTPVEAPAAAATAQMRTVVFPVLEPSSPVVLNAGLVLDTAAQLQDYPAPEITTAADLPWIPEVQAALETINAPVRKAKVPVAANSLHLAESEVDFPGPHAVAGPIPGMHLVFPPGGLPSSMPGVMGLPSSGPLGQPGQPVQGEALPSRKFWFTVNAELIIYGATEPDAQVEIGGHPIRLRPDGGFSFRFALPDGRYELPVVALSADGVELRGAVLQFARCTQTAGEVGVHPQNPELKKPVPESCV